MLNTTQDSPQLLAGSPDEEPLPQGVTHSVDVILATDGSMQVTHRVHGNFCKREVHDYRRASKMLHSIVAHGWAVSSLTVAPVYTFV